MGIEPTSEAWEASILPLYDARSYAADCTQEWIFRTPDSVMWLVRWHISRLTENVTPATAQMLQFRFRFPRSGQSGLIPRLSIELSVFSSFFKNLLYSLHTSPHCSAPIRFEAARGLVELSATVSSAARSWLSAIRLSP
jgi:hypothetical protein